MNSKVNRRVAYPFQVVIVLYLVRLNIKTKKTLGMRTYIEAVVLLIVCNAL